VTIYSLSVFFKVRYNEYGDAMKSLRIIVNLENAHEIHHPFNKDTLNPDLVHFLYYECLGQANSKIDIHILVEEDLSSEEKAVIRNLIHKHFKEEMREIQIKKQITQVFNLFLFFLGLLFLLISFLLSNKFIEEIFLILGWIAIWEVVENILFSESKENLKYNRYKSLSVARIYFKEDDSSL